MRLLEALFGKRKSGDDFSAEAERVISEHAEILKLRESLRPKNREDPQQKVKWYGDRVLILENEFHHPVARLSFSDRYDELVEDYVSKLREAAAGNRQAAVEVEATRSKAPNLVKEEADYLKSKKAKWEKIKEDLKFSSEASRSELKDRISGEIARERELAEIASPKNKEDMTQWKSYYQQRVSRLELKSVSAAARLVWVTSFSKSKIDVLIRNYVDLLNRAAANEPGAEQEFHESEALIDGIVKAEAVRLRETYAHFFKESSQIVPPRAA